MPPDQPISNTSVQARLDAFFAAVRQALADAPDFAGPFLDALPETPYQSQARADTADLRVLRHWPACLDGASSGLKALVEALKALSPDLVWRQNENYRAGPPDPTFLDNYGYAEICGPYGLIAGELRCGILLLGPHAFYPAHRHPAEEIYIPFGAGRWQRGAAEIAEDRSIIRPAGSLVHHPSQIPHAMRAGAEPLAALYLWRGDLKTEARLD